MMPALIPMQRARPRVTFRSRAPTFVGRRDLRRPSRCWARLLLAEMVSEPFNGTFYVGSTIRLYGRTLLPMWQPEQTNWLHGLPDGHLHGACWQKRPPSRRHERRWPNRASGPLMDFFLYSGDLWFSALTHGNPAFVREPAFLFLL